MSALHTAVAEYLAVRRALGYRLEASTPQLRSFADFLEREGFAHVTTELALRWATLPASAQPAWWAKRLGLVRSFAAFHRATDARSQVPPPGLLPFRARRAQPHLYSPVEVRRLLHAAGELPSPTGLRPATYVTLLGLLAVTGLRLSEALHLDDSDVDLADGLLTIRCTKFGKTRLVPLHVSSACALRRYRRVRDAIRPEHRRGPSFLVSEAGRRLTSCTVHWTFNRLSRQIGLRGPLDQRGPRLHDFRHRFAVVSLLHWYRRGVDAERRLPVLSTFLGHGHVTDTYWYLTAVPELLHLAAARLDARPGAQP